MKVYKTTELIGYVIIIFTTPRVQDEKAVLHLVCLQNILYLLPRFFSYIFCNVFYEGIMAEGLL